MYLVFVRFYTGWTAASSVKDLSGHVREDFCRFLHCKRKKRFGALSTKEDLFTYGKLCHFLTLARES